MVNNPRERVITNLGGFGRGSTQYPFNFQVSIFYGISNEVMLQISLD